MCIGTSELRQLGQRQVKLRWNCQLVRVYEISDDFIWCSLCSSCSSFSFLNSFKIVQFPYLFLFARAGCMDNIKARVPRCAYRGIVTIWKDGVKLHIAPSVIPPSEFWSGGANYSLHYGSKTDWLDMKQLLKIPKEQPPIGKLTRGHYSQSQFSLEGHSSISPQL